MLRPFLNLFFSRIEKSSDSTLALCQVIFAMRRILQCNQYVAQQLERVLNAAGGECQHGRRLPDRMMSAVRSVDRISGPS